MQSTLYQHLSSEKEINEKCLFFPRVIYLVHHIVDLDVKLGIAYLKPLMGYFMIDKASD